MFAIARKFASYSHNHVKWVLLLAIGILASVQMFLDPLASTNYSSYDQMLTKRLWTNPADSKIVIVDIDEASLSQLNSELGRWPWPRETLASAMEWLENKGAQAVVFDILFADLDAVHPRSDQAFADAVAQSRNSFFPILRLNPENDAISQIRANQLIGFTQPLGNDPAPNLALVPPVFDSIIQTGRLGYHNIYPDKDGINRHYDLWQDKEGWRMWSLPARLANSFDWEKGDTRRVLINFNAKANAYQTVPFHEVWRLSQTRAGLAADQRFDGAIVVIGATASSLFDVKASPITSIHPGVHVLANVIDNLKNGHFLRELPHSFKFFTVWTCLLLMGLASSRMKPHILRWSVLIIPALLLAVSYASLHVGHWYIDLSGSASHALLFFTAMSVHQNWRLNHFAELKPMIESQLAKGSNTLYKACIVTAYAPKNVKPQRLINHAANCGSQAAVVQAGWFGELIGVHSGPSCVLLVDHNKHSLESAIQKILSSESSFLTHSYLSEITPWDSDHDFSDKDSTQILWREVAKALIKWENDQN
jgi:CHASE2 domain-containing sensor protein